MYVCVCVYIYIYIDTTGESFRKHGDACQVQALHHLFFWLSFSAHQQRIAYISSNPPLESTTPHAKFLYLDCNGRILQQTTGLFKEMVGVTPQTTLNSASYLCWMHPNLRVSKVNFTWGETHVWSLWQTLRQNWTTAWANDSILWREQAWQRQLGRVPWNGSSQTTCW